MYLYTRLILQSHEKEMCLWALKIRIHEYDRPASIGD